MRALLVALGSVVALVAANSSCVMELEHSLACGDGYVDGSVGEECDPGISDSYADGCEGTGIVGLPRCDPDTCTIVCEGCGDGIVQGDSVDGLLAEECDAGPYAGGQGKHVAPRACTLLAPWDPSLPYASGISDVCTSSCFFDRSPCSYCGNGTAEESWPLAPELANQPDARSLAENCDGETFAPGFKAANCPGDTQPNAECAADCRGTIPRGDAPCCVPSGGPCDDPSTCCHAHTDPNTPQHCVNPLTGELSDDEQPTGGGFTCR